MYYGTVTVTTIPGKRFAAIEHLKKLAKLSSEKYGVPTEVLGNGTGPIYKCHVVSKYQNMAQLDETNKKLLADPAFQEWFQAGEGLIAWQDARSDLFEVFE
jgi:quinol monooxygenase YgiN